MSSIQGSNVAVSERIDRDAKLIVYGGDVDGLQAGVDKIVESKRATCSMAANCALRATCSGFTIEGDGTSGYMGLFGSEPSEQGVTIIVSDTNLDCPQPEAYREAALEAEDTL